MRVKKMIFLIPILFLLGSCSVNKAQNEDFIVERFIKSSNDDENITASYNSYAGVLIRYDGILQVKLDAKEKKEIFEYFKILKLNSSSVCYEDYDGNKKIRLKIVFGSITPNAEKKCSENQKDIEKHLLLYAKITQYIQSTEDFKKEFPPLEEY